MRFGCGRCGCDRERQARMSDMDRRRLLGGAFSAGGLAAGGTRPALARSTSPGVSATPTLSGENIKLVIERGSWTVDGRAAGAVLVNGSLPGPLLRLKEGQPARIAVENRMDEETSIHWHGVLTPPPMDGVPGVSFPGIPPRSTFFYEFPVVQNGTYWFHGHSGFQIQEGLYGPIIIDPRDADPVACDREHVVVLSDFSFIRPGRILTKLKQEGGVFNYQRQTIAGLLAGRDQTFRERMEWGRMLMDPSDISDVTGAVYTYLVNGHGPKDNWTALFKPGERVRLRFINAAAQTIFDVRIPGLRLTVVAADGQNVRPVAVDEIQIANAETYDVIVQPADERAYAIVAEAVDRSGLARATLAPRPGMIAEVPPLRVRPLASMQDMGMDMSAMAAGDGMGGMEVSTQVPLHAPQVKLGPGVQMIAPMPKERTGEPGQGLASVGHRVLVYKDLVALEPSPDPRPPTRAVEIRLTGNMERFMWGFDGLRFDQAARPYMFQAGERVRVTLVNDTMMAHPIHLHGHFFELADGPEGRQPRKHTVNVLPGAKLSWDFTPAPGDWAFHCHMFFHMAAGMFQVFAVRPLSGAAA
jgi:FtsP/CotA-like multicopper oxidase with cupredoxin domain